MEQHLLIRYLLKILCHGRKDCPVLSLNQVKPLTKLLALSGWKIQGVDLVDWLLFQRQYRHVQTIWWSDPQIPKSTPQSEWLRVGANAPIDARSLSGRKSLEASVERSRWRLFFESINHFFLRFLCHVSWPRSRCNKSAFMNLLLLKFHLCTRVHCENKFSINISVIKVTAYWRQMDHYNCNLYDLQLLRI